jgi:3D (Asp-Asp-Asp) domain-containing protein
MDDTTLYSKVKEQLGITTEDTLVKRNLLLKTIAVKLYLIKAGAKQMVTDPVTGKNNISDIDVACIAIGVNDLLSGKAGEIKFSPAFNIIAMQICRG